LNGWIKLHRSLLEWEWYRDQNTKAVFIHLLLLANVGTSRYKGFTLSSGQLITSIAEISAATGLTSRQIRTAINHLKSTNELTSRSTNKFTLITIVKWKFYQAKTDGATNKSTSSELHERQTTDKQPTSLIEECKKIKTEEVKKIGHWL